MPNVPVGLADGSPVDYTISMIGIINPNPTASSVAAATVNNIINTVSTGR
jgi:hypothetical protein